MAKGTTVMATDNTGATPVLVTVGSEAYDAEQLARDVVEVWNAGNSDMEVLVIDDNAKLTFEMLGITAERAHSIAVKIKEKIPEMISHAKAFKITSSMAVHRNELWFIAQLIMGMQMVKAPKEYLDGFIEEVRRRM